MTEPVIAAIRRLLRPIVEDLNTINTFFEEFQLDEAIQASRETSGPVEGDSGSEPDSQLP